MLFSLGCCYTWLHGRSLGTLYRHDLAECPRATGTYTSTSRALVNHHLAVAAAVRPRRHAARAQRPCNISAFRVPARARIRPATARPHRPKAVPFYLVHRTAVTIRHRAAVWSLDIACSVALNAALAPLHVYTSPPPRQGSRNCHYGILLNTLQAAAGPHPHEPDATPRACSPRRRCVPLRIITALPHRVTAWSAGPAHACSQAVLP